ncbi:MAG: VOC family protein [Burkholderiaceae bacterium]|jgi:hypothetical protein|nr:VOC family protein [Burkholderiaceae bacterium]
MRSEIDHLVVACADLDQGSAWARDTLGVEPVAGGKHATMGTHNRLLRLGPRLYLELIAIDPDAPAPAQPRWFDLDSAALQARIAQAPQLVTWVAATDDLYAATAAVPMLGEATPFERGDYRWRFALTEAGRLNFGGVLPHAIEWLGAHPAERLPEAGCTLRTLSLSHPAAASIVPLFRAIRLMGPIDLNAGPRQMRAQLSTPRGDVTIAA